MSKIVKCYNVIVKKIRLFLVNRVYVGTKEKYFEKKRRLLIKSGFEIGEGTRIVGPIQSVNPIKIGKNCWIGANLTVHGNGFVSIGDNCDLAPDIAFLTGGHSLGNHSRRAGKGESYSIQISNGVWIGARSTIGRNVTISDSSIIAACACVMQDIDSDCLVGGVPARIIRRLESEGADSENCGE